MTDKSVKIFFLEFLDKYDRYRRGENMNIFFWRTYDIYAKSELPVREIQQKQVEIRTCALVFSVYIYIYMTC